MALWPFRRKTRRKRSRNPVDEANRGRPVENVPATQTYMLPDAPQLISAPGPPPRTSMQRPSPNKLQRRQRTYSFSPGRRDSIRVAGRRVSTRARQEPVPPVPPLPHVAPRADRDAAFNQTTREDEEERVDSGVSAMDDDAFYRVPTLHNKRDGDHLPRKMSSKKRRKHDHAREAEIKAMTNFMPHRPAAEEWAAGRTPKKDSKRVRTGFGFGFRAAARHEWDKENRSSEISLPSPESIHSSLSTDSEPITWKVSALEALAPRPTLRYVTNPRTGSPDAPAKRPYHPRKLTEPVSEDTLRAHKRIDDLANDLSASDLRELMERDQRRRERRRQREQEKMERRLARRAEKQREAEAAALQDGRESPPNLERGVLGRDAVGLGIDPASAVVTSSRRRSSDASSPAKSPRQLEKSPVAEDAEPMDVDPRPHPLDTFHRPGSKPAETVLSHPQAEAPAEPELPVLVPPPSPKSRNFLRLYKSRSRSPQSSDAKVTAPSETSRKASETSSFKRLSWSRLFRWGSRKKRRTEGNGEPSSFSNTSRDSMQPGSQPVPTPPMNFMPRKLGSGVPKRTMSRFREDLPELPVSPPDSRIQSPEAEQMPPTITEASVTPDVLAEEDMAVPAAQVPRYDTPASERLSVPRDAGSSLGHREEFTPSPDPPSMSLASIDSEASWLSGRMNKKRRSSGIMEITRNHYPQRYSGSDKSQSHEHEDALVADDEYLARFAHNSKNPNWNRESTGEARPSSDGDEDEEARWGSVRGQQPTVVHKHVVGRMKSYEGMLNFGNEAQSEIVLAGADEKEMSVDADAEGDSPIIEEPGLQRATSIKLGGGHARKISAGSARLLSITPRSSVDAKRRSWEPPKVDETA